MALAAADLAARIGQEVGLSRWFVVDQARIDAFAEVTEDRQFIHVGPAEDSPFGTTIAHGFLTLSLLAPMAYDALPALAGQRMAVNYGFDRIRFLSPVPSGARLRGRFVLTGAEEKSSGIWQVTHRVTVEIEGQDKPALAADWIDRRYL